MITWCGDDDGHAGDIEDGEDGQHDDHYDVDSDGDEDDHFFWDGENEDDEDLDDVCVMVKINDHGLDGNERKLLQDIQGTLNELDDFE